MAVIEETRLTQSAEKRLMRELQILGEEKYFGVKVSVLKSPDGAMKLDKWDILIDGPEGSPYEGYVLRARMEFPSQYPYQPPKFKFISPVFHPNVYEDGKVCISILHTDQDEIIDADVINSSWTPGLSVRTVCISIVSLLNEPNIFSAANVDASKLYRDDKVGYEKKVKEYLDNAGDKRSSDSLL